MLKKNIKHQDFFVIRTPRIPLDKLLSLGTNLTETKASIEYWLTQPEFIEAVYLASPSLHERIVQSKANKKQNKKVDKKLEAKLHQAIVKYIIRMSARPTPFGLFSGIHKGNITLETNLNSDDLSQDSRKTRLDMFYLTAIKEFFAQSNARSPLLQYYPNTTHYYVGKQCRYIEAYQSNKAQQYRLSAIEIDKYSSFLLQKSRQGKSFYELVNLFMLEYPKAQKEDVVEYLQDLIDARGLVASVSMPITGVPPHKALINSLIKLGEVDVVDNLATAVCKLEQLDHDMPNEPDSYKKIISHLSKVPIQAQENKLFQTDVYRSFSQCDLAESQVESLLNKLMLLNALGHSKPNYFNDFIRKFNHRFEGQLVSMMSLLDEESGISFSNETGYEAPLIAGLELITNNVESLTINPPSVLDCLITQAITLPENRSSSVVNLSSKSLKKHLKQSSVKNELPVSFAAVISLYEMKSEKEKMKEELLIKFNGCYGPSAANLLGRFCHLDDSLKNSVIDHLEKEPDHSKDVIFAEIVHMPEGRLGNVIARPHLRKYEIVFLADSCLTSEYQLSLSDLYVCVEGEQVKLWSKRLGKRVIPRLSCAHNTHSNSLSAYKFLSLLQYQEGMPPSFSMPASQEHASFVPRIMLDNLILSEKTWRLPREDLAQITINGKFNTSALNALKLKYQLDDYITLITGDNVLNLNLSNPMMLDILLQETKGQLLVELKESLVCQYSTPVKSTENESYANELIIPYLNYGAKVQEGIVNVYKNDITTKNVKRHFSPGSEWLSLKVYSGHATLDALLAEKIIPFVEDNSKLFKKWFFIRYSDPDWHLRIRFYGKAEDLCSYLLPNLNKLFEPLIASGELHNFELFTYDREVERYGGADTIDLVEELFSADSNLVIKSIIFQSRYGGEDIRWRITLLMIDTLLNSFGFTGELKLSLITELRNGFGKEFNESGVLRKQLGLKYKLIERTLKSDFSIAWFSEEINKGSVNNTQQIESFDEEALGLIDLLKDWQRDIYPVIKKLNESGELQSLNISCLVRSVLHMHINRMFKAYGREHELIMYDFLRRYYFSLRMRGE